MRFCGLALSQPRQRRMLPYEGLYAETYSVTRRWRGWLSARPQKRIVPTSGKG